MNHITITGVGGTVRWGYAVAARLGTWTIDGGILRAALIDVDPFRLVQSGLTFELPSATGGAPATRPLVDVAIVDAGRRLSARLGPKE